jgi:ABC-2 type transport system ATP-binding protein
MSEVAVLADQLTRRFGDFVAVDRVSFSVSKGEIFGFLGPNGAGKTTTIKMLAGLLPPSSGCGVVAGFDAATEAEAIKRHIGYMSQLFSLYADLSVEENIGFYARLYGVPARRRAERRDWVLSMARLEDQRRRRTAELPLGWKQRLALGCALLHEPPILFLDEPTSGVDPISRRSFWETIYELAEAGTTVFVTTHYMEEAEYCNRLALMNRGRLIALDRPAELRAGVVEVILEVRVDRPAEATAALKDAPAVVEASMYGRSLHVAVTDPDEGREGVAARLAERGIQCRGIARITPSLEDAFVAYVRAAGGAPVD